ncbi:hypothetical protein ABTH34_19985, partial [Acinetobacter baumannii]
RSRTENLRDAGGSVSAQSTQLAELAKDAEARLRHAAQALVEDSDHLATAADTIARRLSTTGEAVRRELQAMNASADRAVLQSEQVGAA